MNSSCSNQRVNLDAVRMHLLPPSSFTWKAPCTVLWIKICTVPTNIHTMRSTWKGHIRFSLVTIPIQVFSAINTKGNIKFKQLHGEDNGKIQYQKTCSHCEEEVKFADIVKGYEYEPDQFVVLTKAELNAIKLKSTKAIDIEAFVDLDEVHPSRFEAVYFVGPNGDVAIDSFNLFRQALISTNKAGVGRIILRDREDVVLIAPQGKGLVMYKMRFPYELRDINKVPDLKDAPVDDKQLELAQTLIASLDKPFEEVDFEDRYRAALLDIVEAKVKGQEVVTLAEEPEEAPVVDIMDALKKSIEAAKKKGA